MNKLILYHGSNEKIEKPLFVKGKVYNDYGQGFYEQRAKDINKATASNLFALAGLIGCKAEDLLE